MLARMFFLSCLEVAVRLLKFDCSETGLKVELESVGPAASLEMMLAL